MPRPVFSATAFETQQRRVDAYHALLARTVCRLDAGETLARMLRYPGLVEHVLDSLLDPGNRVVWGPRPGHEELPRSFVGFVASVAQETSSTTEMLLPVLSRAVRRVMHLRQREQVLACLLDTDQTLDVPQDPEWTQAQCQALEVRLIMWRREREIELLDSLATLPVDIIHREVHHLPPTLRSQVHGGPNIAACVQRMADDRRGSLAQGLAGEADRPGPARPRCG